MSEQMTSIERDAFAAQENLLCEHNHADEQNGEKLLLDCQEHTEEFVTTLSERATALAQRADELNADELAELGVAFLYGYGVDCDEDRAFEFLTRAAEQSSQLGVFYLGICYVDAVGTTCDCQRGADLLRACADQDNVQAMKNLAMIYASGRLGVEDFQQASEWMTRAAFKGDVEATEVALQQLLWEDVTSDLEKGLALAQDAVTRGNCDAAYQLATCYAQGHGVTKDCQRAIQLYEISAQQGDPAGLLEIAKLAMENDRLQCALDACEKAARLGADQTEELRAQIQALMEASKTPQDPQTNAQIDAAEKEAKTDDAKACTDAEPACAEMTPPTQTQPATTLTNQSPAQNDNTDDIQVIAAETQTATKPTPAEEVKEPTTANEPEPSEPTPTEKTTQDPEETKETTDAETDAEADPDACAPNRGGLVGFFKSIFKR